MQPYLLTPGIYFLNIVVFGLIVWGVQKYFSNVSDRRLADFKGIIDQQLLSYKSLYDQQIIEFKVQFDQQIEKYKSELKFLNDKLATLHTKRIDIIKETNDLLVKLSSAMIRLVAIRPVNPDPEEEKKTKESILIDVQKSYAEYNNFILFNKIYFSKDLADALENIRQQYFNAQWDLFEPDRLRSMGVTTAQAYRESGQLVINASNNIREEIPKAIANVEAEFRKILGVD